MSSQIRRRTSTAPPRASAIKIFERNKEAPVAPKRTTKEAIILFSLCLIAILGTIAVMSTIGLSSDKGLQKQRRSAVLPRSRQGRSYEYLARDACSEWGALPQFDEGHNKWCQSNCMSGYCPSDICQCTVPIVKPAST